MRTLRSIPRALPALLLAFATVARAQVPDSATLASFKVPARIVEVEAIPKGPTGKIQRRIMADLIGAR